MFAMMRFNRRKEREASPPRVPEGYRAYAIGDVHGRADLLRQLLDQIEEDDRARPPCKTLIIFLGDLIDRGPDSRGVLDFLRAYNPPGTELHFLAGNHEEVLLRILAGSPGLIRNWLRFGGAECLKSYGCDPSRLQRASEREGMRIIRKAIPESHVSFLSSFADTLRLGDYLFVHAGIRPGVDITLQTQADLRWIRSPFLDHDGEHGFVVVHGHTIAGDVDWRSNRIGIDTGAYETGVLTALGVEGEENWTVQAVGERNELGSH